MNRQEEMAIFLIDNSIDLTFKCCRIDLQEEDSSPSRRQIIENNVIEVKLNVPPTVHKGSTAMSSKGSTSSSDETTALADVFVVSCRQLAYEKEMYNIVNLIDFKQGCLLKWLKPPSHNVRLIKSARLANEASIEPILPPDRMRCPPTLISRKRTNRHKHKLKNSTVSSPQAHTEPSDLSLVAQPPSNNSNWLPNPSSVHESESVVLQNGSSWCGSEKARGRHDRNTTNHGQCLTPNIHMTKTAVIRQRKNNLSIYDQRYRLRHPESSDISLTRPSTRQQSGSEKQPVVPENCSNRVLYRQQPKTGHSSYANHLPFRRKPIHFEGYIEQMFKKSMHCYQHSAKNTPQSKFIGRL
ncbi:uncharacterized protein [Watersipora subatra]